MFVWFCADVGLDLAFDEPRGLFSELGDEGVEVGLGALGFEHDGAVGLVADPSRDWVAFGDEPGAGSEPDALDSALEDDSEAGDHACDCSG